MGRIERATSVTRQLLASGARSFSARATHTTTNNSRAAFSLGAGALFLGSCVSVYSLSRSSPAAVCEEHAAARAHAKATQVQAPKSMEADVKFNTDDFALFSGRANPALAQEIADQLGVKLGRISIKGYADGEIGIQVNENVRGKDVYLVQPTCPPGVNDQLVELLLMVSTMRRASAMKITAVIPYYGYARQDRKMASRVPISAADVARLLQAMGVDRVVAVDLHCGQIQGFFGPRTPCDNLEAHVVVLPFFRDLGLKAETTKVVSPDAGGVYRAKRFRDGLSKIGVDAGLAMIVKQRTRPNEIGRMDLVGDVQGCDVIMVDDMIDTAGTLVSAAHELKIMGAKRIFAFATHGLFSGPAYTRIANSDLEKVVVCNTVPLQQTSGDDQDKIVQVSIAGLLADAIRRIHLKKSVSALFTHNAQATSGDVPLVGATQEKKKQTDA